MSTEINRAMMEPWEGHKGARRSRRRNTRKRRFDSLINILHTHGKNRYLGRKVGSDYDAHGTFDTGYIDKHIPSGSWPLSTLEGKI